MTNDQKFTLLLTAIGLLFTMLSFAIGMIWRNGNKAGKATTIVQGLAEDVKKIGKDLDSHIRWHMEIMERRGKA
jgi:hypothetical protein